MVGDGVAQIMRLIQQPEARGLVPDTRAAYAKLAFQDDLIGETPGALEIASSGLRRHGDCRPVGLIPIGGGAADFGDSGVAAGACRHGGRTDRPDRPEESTRALPPESQRGRDQESLLLRYGCNAPQHIAPRPARAPVLHRLRGRSVVQGDLFGLWEWP